MAQPVMPEHPKRWEPSEAIGTGLATLVLVGAARAWNGSAEPWHYGLAGLSVLLVLGGLWDWARGRKVGCAGVPRARAWTRARELAEMPG